MTRVIPVYRTLGLLLILEHTFGSHTEINWGDTRHAPEDAGMSFLVST